MKNIREFLLLTINMSDGKFHKSIRSLVHLELIDLLKKGGSFKKKMKAGKAKILSFKLNRPIGFLNCVLWPAAMSAS